MAKDKRVEVLFDPADYRRLEEVARREGKPVGAMIREAVAKYVVGPSEAEREAAWADFLEMCEQGLGGPVGSPEEIKEEILKGYDEDDARLYGEDFLKNK
jgi:predicted transcriptional regulator